MGYRRISDKAIDSTQFMETVAMNRFQISEYKAISNIMRISEIILVAFSIYSPIIQNEKQITIRLFGQTFQIADFANPHQT